MNLLNLTSFQSLSLSLEGNQSSTGGGAVSTAVWVGTIILIIALLLFDFFVHVRKAHEPRLKEAAIWSGIYIAIAIVFGVCLYIFGDAEMGTAYFAGYITEKALSIDNLFVFIIIMTSFKVPRADQQKVLLFGIVFALIARTIFILVGAALLEQFVWLFYLFGVILLWSAISMIRKTDEHDEGDNFIIKFAKKHLKTSEHYDGDKLFTYENGKRVLTPMLLVMIAIGGTDILFALDSIPAIFGITQNAYIVFAANAFALLGMRQLYFLLDGLLGKLVFLSYGLAVILGFIGVKLILHALHQNNLPFINEGKPLEGVPEISTEFSLIFIGGVLLITIVASLMWGKKKPQENEKTPGV